MLWQSAVALGLAVPAAPRAVYTQGAEKTTSGGEVVLGVFFDGAGVISGWARQWDTRKSQTTTRNDTHRQTSCPTQKRRIAPSQFEP